MTTPGEVDVARPWAGDVLDRTRAVTALLEADGTVLECSQGLAELAGTVRGHLVGRPLEAAPRWLRSPGRPEGLRAALDAALAGGCVRHPVEASGDAPGAVLELTPVLRDGRVVRIHVGAATGTAPGPSPEQAGDLRADADVGVAERAQLQLALDAAGMALWTWDVTADRIVWSPSHRSMAGVDLQDGPMPRAIERLVHPLDHERVQAGLVEALGGRSSFDLEFRLNDADRAGPARWLLARGCLHRDAEGTPVRMIGVLLDITERALARDQHARLLHTERRSSRRATALQRVAAALAEAATTEQVAAVMVEESLRWLRADAARVELHPAGAEHQLAPVVRTAGVARLLGDGGTSPHERTGAARIELPLLNRGHERGRWALAWRTEDGHPHPRGDWSGPDGRDLLRTLATECAESFDRAALYEQQRDIATVLQRTLLPSVLPAVPGAEVAARYSPGGRGVDVGGDWYDVIALPDGRTGLVIGDVEGHSAEAAAVMGQVRNALRAYAVEGSTPATVMARVNRLLVRLGVDRLVSCCYLEFSAREGTAIVALAGHPPPLVLRPDGRIEYVPAAPNIVLGVAEAAAFVETTVLLDPGSCLLMFTDGLVECVSRALPEGLAALRDWARDWEAEDGAEALVEMLVRRAHQGVPVADDVAVLGLRYLPRPRPRSRLHVVRRTLPLDPVSASAARRFVCDVLGQWGHDDLAHQVTLMTSELVTNSVLHTSGELELAIYRDVDRLRVEVVDRSDRLPAVQAPDADAPGGRGLLIIEALSSAWGVEGRGDGKAVWFEVALDADGARR